LVPDVIDRADVVTLRRSAREFARFPSPWILGAAALAAVIARAAIGGWRWSEVLIPAGILAIEPFTEWAIHVFLLHFRPRTIGGRRIDPFVARKHRAHHADPRNLPLVFVPVRVVVPSIAVGAFIARAAAPDLRRALTGMAAAYAMFLVYEWTHFLIHSSYRPRTRVYRGIWRAHRLHHYRNEQYWFGVTMHLGDRVLRTYPDKDDVPVSATARTLGVEAA
jgi:sterol desaturase/sphingolipid hydroxylase (fatty acid hydroxylase superfamily)